MISCNNYCVSCGQGIGQTLKGPRFINAEIWRFSCPDSINSAGAAHVIEARLRGGPDPPPAGGPGKHAVGLLKWALPGGHFGLDLPFRLPKMSCESSQLFVHN